MTPEQQAQLNQARHRRAAALAEIELLTIEYLANLAHMKNEQRTRRLLEGQRNPQDAAALAAYDESIKRRQATQARQRAALKREKAALNQANQTKRALLTIKAHERKEKTK